MRVTQIIAIASTVVALSFVDAASADNHSTAASSVPQTFCKAMPAMVCWYKNAATHTKRLLVVKRAKTHAKKLRKTTPTQIICMVFGSYCSQAMSVARCESGLRTNASNGQYLGLFQMGSSERRIYGHGGDAMTQAKAAHAYFVASGKDWSPWSCKPSFAAYHPKKKTTAKRQLAVVTIAKKYLGTPYRWGGSSPAGFDCSGFVKYVYSKVGVDLPHNAASDFQVGDPVSQSNLEPGDLVFFSRLGHVGIYVDDGMMIHSPQSGDVVRLSTIYRGRGYVGARRVL